MIHTFISKCVCKGGGGYVSVEDVTVKVPGTEYSSTFAEGFGPFSAVGDGLQGREYGDDDNEEDEGDLACATGGFNEAGSGSEEIPCLTETENRKV